MVCKKFSANTAASKDFTAPPVCITPASVDSSAIEAVGAILIDSSRPLKERFRALFTLKNIGGKTAIDCISKCFKDTSALLKHECAYCLGQMQDTYAIPILADLLSNKNVEVIVRHEAGIYCVY